jgi:hypothetical protein
MTTRRRVLIESPFHADTPEGIEANLAYARLCLKDSLLRGEAPLASHILYPQVLDDNIETERIMGIRAGLAWGLVADCTAVYRDHGISRGMQMGIDDAVAAGRPIEYRELHVYLTASVTARRSRTEVEAERIPGLDVGGFRRRTS